MAYIVRIEDTDDGKGAHHTDDNLAVAICEAVGGSRTITARALVVGVLAFCIANEDMTGKPEEIARSLIDSLGVPANMKSIVELMDIP